ncbi:MAG: hypothetical protein ACHQIH_04150 [Ignavibacteria bacterium]
MINTKITKFFKSFRGRLTVIIALLAVTASLLFTIFYLRNHNPQQEFSNDQKRSVNTSSDDKQNAGAMVTGQIIDAGIDSVLSNFGIKKEWITTYYNPALLKTDPKHSTKEADWFSKGVLIPVDLNSIEVNVDISNYLNIIGITSSVNEDIITKNIVISALKPDTVSTGLPLVKISVSHSDKITRESSLFCLILDNIGDYKKEEIEKFVIGKTEFSFIFPRSLDDIDIQNKLLQNKKDVIISLTLGSKDNYDADFSTNLDEKSVRDKVKSFSSDFPTIRTVVLTRSEQNLPQSGINMIVEEFNKFNISVINESDLTKMLTPAEEESKDKISIIGVNLRSKAGLSKSMVSLLKINADEFERFYDEILKLKKLGYRFCSFAEYLSRKNEMEKKEKLRNEEQQKELADKKLADKRKTEQKKPKEKKPIEKKKTEVKKPVKPKSNSNGEKKKK